MVWRGGAMAAIPAMNSRSLIGHASEPLYGATYRLQGCPAGSSARDT
jgi:hypothetical protein